MTVIINELEVTARPEAAPTPTGATRGPLGASRASAGIAALELRDSLRHAADRAARVRAD